MFSNIELRQSDAEGLKWRDWRFKIEMELVLPNFSELADHVVGGVDVDDLKVLYRRMGHAAIEIEAIVSILIGGLLAHKRVKLSLLTLHWVPHMRGYGCNARTVSHNIWYRHRFRIQMWYRYKEPTRLTTVFYLLEHGRPLIRDCCHLRFL